MKKFYLLLCAAATALAAQAATGITLKTDTTAESEITFVVNASSAMQPVVVDCGDGNLQYFTIDPNQTENKRRITATLKGSYLRVDGPVTYFDCRNHHVTAATVEGMSKLETLILSHNKITDIQFVDAAPVKTLRLDYNCLRNTPSTNANLTLSNIGATLTDLNLDHNTDLQCLHMGGLTEIEYLSASYCPKLASIYICSPEEKHEKIKSIKLNHCSLAHFYPVDLPQLRVLELADNQLVSGSADTEPFAIGNYPDLRVFDIADNKEIKDIDLTECTKLEKLYLGGCQLKTIDLSQCPELNTLSASYNKLSHLDLGNNPLMANLFIAGNPIRQLDFTQLKKLANVDISQTKISRVDLYYCYYLQTFAARNTLLEFVDFHAQQPERMKRIDLRDCPAFTPMSMAYTVMTIPCAQSTLQTDTTLFLQGSHPEISNIAYLTAEDMHWICDSKGDGSADYPFVKATVRNAKLTGNRVEGYLERLYPYSGLGLEYDLEEFATDGGRFLLVQWEPDVFQTVTSVTNSIRRGVPTFVYVYPDKGKRFGSVTVNGKEIYSQWFMVDSEATIQVNFDDIESFITLGTELGRKLSFTVATSLDKDQIEIDWGSGTRSPYPGIRAYTPGNYDAIGTRIEGKAAGETITIYGDIAGLDISCYGDVGEEMFGLPNNSITAVNTSGCPQLKLLNLYWNPVRTLDLSTNADLEMLDASYTALSSLDLSANKAVKYLSAYANSDEIGDKFAQINTIDISGMKQLEYLDLHNQNISELNILEQPMLQVLNLNGCRLSSLDPSRNPLLAYLRANHNLIQNIDLSANKELIELSLEGNRLSQIDLSQSTKLQHLNIAFNNIKALDASMLPDLGKVFINSNGISAEQLNDIYYKLPVRKPRPDDDDPMAIKFDIIANQGNDEAPNDGEGADGSIAVARKWRPNPMGNNSASATSLLDIESAAEGSIKISDAGGMVYNHGDKIKKYTQLSIEAFPEPGFEYTGFTLNGEELTGDSFLMPGIYTIVTPIFKSSGGIGSTPDIEASVKVSPSGTVEIIAPNSVAKVYGTNGALITQISVQGGCASISDLEPGAYIVEIKGKKVSLTTKIFIRL